MIQDQILYNGNYLPLNIRCISCNQLGHIAHQCQLIHFVPDREKIIKRYNYYVDQERTINYIRRGRKKKALQQKGRLLETNNKIIQESGNDRNAILKLYSDDIMSLCSSEGSLIENEKEFEECNSSEALKTYNGEKENFIRKM